MTTRVTVGRFVIILLTLLANQVLLVSAAGDHQSIRKAFSSDGERALDYQTCVDNLDRVSTDGEVSAQQFLDFLTLQSDGLVTYETFQDVPLDLRLLFYATACSGGQDCSSDTPKLSLKKSEGIVATLIQIFCAQVEVIIVEQQPDFSLKVSFHYNIYYRNDMTPDQIMSQDNGITIVSRLETATERVVSIALGCSEEAGERQLEKRRHGILHVCPEYNEESQNVRLLLTEKEQEYYLRARTTRLSRNLQDCDYTVKAVVEDLIPFVCDPPAPSDDIQCALVASSVLLTAADEDGEISDEQRIELRATVITSVSDSVNDGSFESHLP